MPPAPATSAKPLQRSASGGAGCPHRRRLHHHARRQRSDEARREGASDAAHEQRAHRVAAPAAAGLEDFTAAALRKPTSATAGSAMMRRSPPTNRHNDEHEQRDEIGGDEHRSRAQIPIHFSGQAVGIEGRAGDGNTAIRLDVRGHAHRGHHSARRRRARPWRDRYGQHACYRNGGVRMHARAPVARRRDGRAPRAAAVLDAAGRGAVHVDANRSAKAFGQSDTASLANAVRFSDRLAWQGRRVNRLPQTVGVEEQGADDDGANAPSRSSRTLAVVTRAKAIQAIRVATPSRYGLTAVDRKSPLR